MRCSYLWVFVALQLGLGTAFQQKLAHPVAFRTDERDQQHATRLWQAALDRHQNAWNENYEALVDFHKRHGHTNVEIRSSLYNWMAFQRRRRLGKKHTAPLSDEQIKLLDGIDFPWTPRSRGGFREMEWHTKYQELVEFYKKHGHSRMAKGDSLYDWQIVQRRKREGILGYARLNDDQIQLLDEIDFPWVLDPYQRMWNTNYQELVEFKKKHGHFNVKRPSLHRWMYRQRTRREGKGGYVPLTDEQIRLLDDIDFPWAPRQGDIKWYANYQELVDFYKKHGHLKVELNSFLYSWIARQRRRRRRTKGYAPLTDEQIQLLDEIGLTWTPTKGQ